MSGVLKNWAGMDFGQAIDNGAKRHSVKMGGPEWAEEDDDSPVRKNSEKDEAPARKSYEFKHACTQEVAEARLLDEAMNHSLVVAFDFDNTLYRYKKGSQLRYSKDLDSMAHESVVELLKRAHEAGMTLVLFTCAETQYMLDEKVKFCEDLGLAVKYVNESPVMKGTSKPYYNILLDDRAGLNEAASTLSFVLDRLDKIRSDKSSKKRYK